MLKKKSLEDIAHDFDPKFYAANKVKIGKILQRCIDLEDSPVIGVDKIKDISVKDENAVFIYTANHKSHVDYAFIGFKFFDLGLRPPRYAAGANLFLGPLNRYWRKMGAFSIDRKKRKQAEYLISLYQYVEDIVAKKNDIMLFPEGGRSYSGAFESMKLGIIGAIASAQEKNPNLNVYIVPVIVAYDRVVEDIAYPFLSKIRERKESFWKGFTYYMMDLSRFMGKMIYEPNGKGYITVGDPFCVKGFLDKGLHQKAIRTKISGMIMEGFKKNYPILSTAVVCKILSENEIISKKDLEVELGTLIKRLEGKSYNLDFLPKDPKEIIAEAYNIIGNPMISHISQKRDYIFVRNEKAANYYSNTITFIDEEAK